MDGDGCLLINMDGECVPSEMKTNEMIKLFGISIANLYLTETIGFTGALPYITENASDFHDRFGTKSLEPFFKH